ncbi:MAG TPA: hypothetical protein DCW44_02970 [Eubacterium sp.]|nr:hypothetical protein [Eubacterium sp.]
MKITGEMIGAELKSLRVKKNLSIDIVSQKINIHPNTIAKYEKNASDCKIESFLKLLNLYETNESIFFNIVREYNHIKDE